MLTLPVGSVPFGGSPSWSGVGSAPRAGKPVAKLVRFERGEERRVPGALAGQIHMADDFDELPDDLQEAFGLDDS